MSVRSRTIACGYRDFRIDRSVTGSFLSSAILAIGLSGSRINRRSCPRFSKPSAWSRTASSCPPTAVLDSEMKIRSEEHTSELQSHVNLVCRLLLEKKKKKKK